MTLCTRYPVSKMEEMPSKLPNVYLFHSPLGKKKDKSRAIPQGCQNMNLPGCMLQYLIDGMLFLTFMAIKDIFIITVLHLYDV